MLGCHSQHSLEGFMKRIYVSEYKKGRVKGEIQGRLPHLIMLFLYFQSWSEIFSLVLFLFISLNYSQNLQMVYSYCNAYLEWYYIWNMLYKKNIYLYFLYIYIFWRYRAKFCQCINRCNSVRSLQYPYSFIPRLKLVQNISVKIYDSFLWIQSSYIISLIHFCFYNDYTNFCLILAKAWGVANKP